MASETNQDLPESHLVIAELRLSGELVRIGHIEGKNDIFFQNETMTEPHYMSRSEALLLAKAIKTTVDNSNDES